MKRRSTKCRALAEKCCYVAIVLCDIEMQSHSTPMKSRLWGYKKMFMLNSAEHEIFPAHKY